MSTPNSALVAGDNECSICLDALEFPALTPCQHWFCKVSRQGREEGEGGGGAQ